MRLVRGDPDQCINRLRRSRGTLILDSLRCRSSRIASNAGGGSVWFLPRSTFVAGFQILQLLNVLVAAEIIAFLGKDEVHLVALGSFDVGRAC